MTETFEKAYLADEAIRWRKTINNMFVNDRIREKKEQVEWSKSNLYPHPLKAMRQPKRHFNVLDKLRMFIP